MTVWDLCWVKALVVRMLGLAGPKVLALDRTNWKLGSRDMNILVLAIVTQRFRVPLMWSLLDHGATRQQRNASR